MNGSEQHYVRGYGESTSKSTGGAKENRTHPQPSPCFALIVLNHRATMNVPIATLQYISNFLVRAQDKLAALNIDFYLGDSLGTAVNSIPAALSEALDRIIVFLDNKSPQSGVGYIFLVLVILYVVYSIAIAAVRWVVGTVVGFLKFVFFIFLLGASVLVINQLLDEQPGDAGDKFTAGAGGGEDYYF
ncbi:hypothetical protein BC936DRAFT_142324 [Jimgerdemannia flammicorona]|uniref:Uncharacterized protein n=1 Tax=Jimgerdemannia flammicorona TaxID=994334 RepID=A0A433DFC1_9FUNG|nr:hypothetical protein BC936DRAFT_142324 [Jimgerdemannia flammicorona]